MDRILFSGNEAIARGAYEAGVKVCSAYPGTPSTEVFEALPQYRDSLYCEWAPNEKVATEVAYGASLAGVRSLCAMKHVGVNVAADPIFTAAYNGVGGGFVIVSADDPSMHSSQNEQDNRHYARAAKLAMVEPSDSQECLDFMREAYRISEQFDIPVLFRTTTRVAHSKSIVTFGEREEQEAKPYARNTRKNIASPANAFLNHPKLEKTLEALEAYGCTSPLNRMELNGTKVGVISASIAYEYAKDAFPADTSFLKLGLTNPLPMDLIRSFAEKVEKLYIIENIDATVIAQSPKMAPYIDQMRENICNCLCIDKDQVNIKATTEEKLGFTGGGLGISSQAVCLIESAFNYAGDDAGAVRTAGCGGCGPSVGTLNQAYKQNAWAAFRGLPRLILYFVFPYTTSARSPGPTGE